ncbi:MAG: PIN domain-containing protein [Chromatiaceae bacterium]|nr:MAG: PIN domain-containing protein [Chromatiaceae bacterium]
MAAYLLDTNVVLRLFDRNAPEHEDCKRAVESLQQAGHALVLAPQVIYEFWVVSTRPPEQRRGFGWSADRAAAAVDHLLRGFALRPDSPEVFAGWRDIVRTHRVQGKRAHDARLVAFQQAHRIEHFMTLNGKDFRDLTNQVLAPDEVGTSP